MAKISAESNPSISNPQSIPLQQPNQPSQNPSNVFSFGFGLPPNMNLPQNAQIRTNNTNSSGNVVIRAVSTDGNLQNLSQTVNNLIGNLMGPQNVSNQNITQNNNIPPQSQPLSQPQNQSNPIIINNNNNNHQNNVQNNDVCYLQSFYINFNLYYFQES